MASDAPTQTCQDLMRFIDASPTAGHAVAAARARLDAAGFVHLDERDPFELAPGQGFYVQRFDNSLLAGRLGSASPAEAGFRIAGAHTDAPGLRLKPRASYSSKGYLQLGVEVYGGPILATWVDRDLTLAGKIYVRRDKAPPRAVLVRADRPLCRIPSLAIHFDREVNDKGLRLDKQKHLPPLWGLGGDEALRAEPLLAMFAEQAAVTHHDIVATDLEVVDTQPASLGGLRQEFLFAPRIDNMAGSHAVLSALLDAPAAPRCTQVIALFDSEEVGSQTHHGAGSRLLDALLERLCLQFDDSRETLHRALARSYLVSVDGAHALHPNYADVHDPHHQPVLGGGPVIKHNAQQRYATGALSGHWFERCARKANVPVQHYVQRSDLPCGSTIGPMTATRLGLRSVDVGNPMLSMHSIRETGGVADQHSMVRALVEHFSD